MALTDKLKALADIIRTRKGVTDKYTIDQMIEEFNNMPQGNPYEIADKIVYGQGAGLTEYISNTRRVKDYSFYLIEDLITVSLPNVEYIGPSAFKECRNIRTLNIPAENNITEIPKSAFEFAGYNNTNESDVYTLTFPNLKSIGGRAFADSALKSFTAPKVKNIQYAWTFAESKLENISMDGLINIKSINTFYSTKLREVELPNLQYIDVAGSTDATFQNCRYLTKVSLPELIDITGGETFYGCISLTEVNLPKVTNALPKYTFYGSMVKGSTLNFPELLYVNSNYSTFSECGATNYIFGKLEKLGSYSFGNSHIKDLTILSRKMVVAADNTIFGNVDGPGHTVFADSSSTETCYLRVRSYLIDSYKNDPNWKAAIVNPNIQYVAVDDQPIESIYIWPIKDVNLFIGDGRYATVQLNIDFNENDLAAPDQRSATYEIIEGSDLFDINSDGVLTAKVNTDIGEARTVTVKVTSTIDQSISCQASFNAIYMPAHYTIDTHDGQFIVDESASGENVIYKSDAGSYHFDSGYSLATVTFIGYSSITVKYRSDAEGSYDYLIVGALDVTDLSTADRDRLTDANRVAAHTKGKQSSTTYSTYTFETDGREHSFMIMYSKDGSANSGTDRGYFYIEA